MPLQTQVGDNQGFGVIGEIFNDGPVRVQPFRVFSTDPLNNVFARGFSIVTEGIAQAGNPLATAIFAGILIGPKEGVLIGDPLDGTLNPQMRLPNNTQGEFITYGSVIVYIETAVQIGDEVLYDNTTGVLSTQVRGLPLPPGQSSAYAEVSHVIGGSGGLAVITLTEGERVQTLLILGPIFGFGPDVGPWVNSNQNFENGNFYE